jgi:hypothetical protein
MNRAETSFSKPDLLLALDDETPEHLVVITSWEWICVPPSLTFEYAKKFLAMHVLEDVVKIYH